MKVHELVRRSEMPVPPSVLFAWHAAPGALQRLLPPWESVQVRRSWGGIEEGGRVELSVPVGPFRARWVAEHDEYREGESFRDVQTAGPFALWEHTHRVEPAAGGSSLLEDRVRYAVPLGAVGDRLAGAAVRRRLERVFAFRHERTRLDLLAHERYRDSGLMRILVSGATGLIGSELTAFLTAGGHRVVPLSRGGNPTEVVRWSPDAGTIEADKLSGFDAVVHLAGESVLGRWTAEKRRRIRDSRVLGTRLLCESLAGLEERHRPRVLVCASATGYYGDRGDEVLTEDSPKGTGFLADVCEQWESACEPARQAGIRVVNVRIGLVLTPKGGLLGSLLPVFRAGLGGRVGGGRQWMSWIAIDDLIDVFHAAVMDESLAGPVNGTAPNPVTNAEFTKTLGRVLGRPTLLPVPRLAVRAALGEAADELALASARVLPARLTGRGHAFRYPELEPALRFLLGS
ncbi:MAG TPA: TIGR01777 family oxidoreductase [Planctomycetaceae bacterium]